MMQGGGIFSNERSERTKMQHFSEDMKVISGSMNINREQMVFLPTNKQPSNKEQQSLTHKNSSDKISVAQSVPDPEGSERNPR